MPEDFGTFLDPVAYYLSRTFRWRYDEVLQMDASVAFESFILEKTQELNKLLDSVAYMKSVK